jgi:hypothetical protein
MPEDDAREPWEAAWEAWWRTTPEAWMTQTWGITVDAARAIDLARQAGEASGRERILAIITLMAAEVEPLPGMSPFATLLRGVVQNRRAEAELTWRCDVCREVRPDAQISVHTEAIPMRGLPLGTASINVKFCNDRAACAAGALTFVRTHYPEPR